MRTLTTLLIAILITGTITALSASTIKPANAQALPIPAIPEFTVKLVNNSYITQPTTTTTTDPYTGKQSTITYPGHYVKDEYVEIQIKNQAFTPYEINYQNIDNRRVNLYFRVIAQGHFSTDRSIVDDSATRIEDYAARYTTIKLYTQQNIPSPAQLDFKAQAIIGYLVSQSDPEEPLPPPDFPLTNYGINGTMSDWSSIQTLTIPTSVSPAPTPAVPEFSIIFLLPLIGLLVVVIVQKKKKK
jgi:hypothetical protein